MDTIPAGLCQCGCGGETTIAKKSDRACGAVRNQPRTFIHGHQRRIRNLPNPNPLGLCLCGCGKRTKIAARTVVSKRMVQGCPLRFVTGHRPPSAVTQPTQCTVDGCQRTHFSGGWCQAHYAKQRKYGDPSVVIREYSAPLEQRFWAKVDKNGPVPHHRTELGPCWVWAASTDGSGYGTIGITGRRSTRASRVSWELTHGTIPEGLWVLHHCDNPPCVNPTHLFLGTVRDNVQDRDRKGRSKRDTAGRYSTVMQNRSIE